MQVSLTLIWSLFRWGLSFQTLSSNHHAHPKRPLPRSSSPPASGWMIPAVSHRALLTSHLHLLHPCIVIMLWFHSPPTSSPQHLDVTVTMATCTHPPPPLQVTGCYLTVCLGGRDVDQVSIYLPVLVDLRVSFVLMCNLSSFAQSSASAWAVGRRAPPCGGETLQVDSCVTPAASDRKPTTHRCWDRRDEL